MRRMISMLVPAVLLGVSGVQPGLASSATGHAAVAVRLPNNVAPTAYSIFVEPVPERGRFTGSETISISVNKPTKKIVLNAIDLKLIRATCVSAEPHAVPMKTRISYQPENEQTTLELPREIDAGMYKVEIDFDGILNDKLRGFYRSSFTDSKGRKQWLATTQMEPTDARRMFPSFDEPSFKAAFSLKVSIDPAMTAISNGAVKDETVDPKTHRKIVQFAETPKMSSYLVALIVGPLQATSVVDSEGVPVRVWSVVGKEAMGKFAQDVAVKLLPYYNNYFGVPYPTKKLDLIAIPDFEAGAMENLGAITFRENALLVDEKTASTSAKQRVASVVAHEMAHMWFGDLVTMKWWDDLWLNEAFATWMSCKAIDHIRPDWHEWDRFAHSRLSAMTSDCLRATRPIHFAVSDPAQVNQMFDEITYEKGASVLRMLEKYVSEATFQDGVQRYIKAHQFSNASTQDLWMSINDAAKKDMSSWATMTNSAPDDINTMMHSWVYQPGYPLLSVDASDTKFGAAQERFLLLARKKEENSNAFSSTWQVPIALRPLGKGDSSAPAHILLGTPQATSKLPLQQPFLVNAGSEGFFRVQYSPQMISAVREHIGELSASERQNLISDSFSLAFTGRTPIKDYLTLTEHFKNESDPYVIGLLTAEFSSLDEVIDEKTRPAFEAFVRDRLRSAKEKLGWSMHGDEDDLTKLVRQDVLVAMGTIGQDKETIAEARGLFKKYVADRNSVDPDIAKAATSIVAFNGSDAEYHQISDLWRKAPTPELEKEFLMALGSFRDRKLLENTLSMSLTDEVRTQDAPNLIAGVVNSIAGRRLGWDYVTTHWRTITERFTPHMVPRIVGAASALNTDEDAQRLKTFFKANPLPFGTRTIAKTIEEVEVNAEFRQRSGSALASWLAANEQPNPNKVQSSMK